MIKKLAVVLSLLAATLYPAPAHAVPVAILDGAFLPAGTAVTDFDGQFCAPPNVCDPIPYGWSGLEGGAVLFDTWVTDTPGDVRALGYSLGGAIATLVERRWNANRTTAPDPARVFLVKYGSPARAYGGDSGYIALAGIDPGTAYRSLDVALQYDSVADKPARWGWYSWLNSSFSQHLNYDHVDVNDPRNLVYQEGRTTYMLSPTGPTVDGVPAPGGVLPMLRWRDWFTSDETMAALDAKYRPLIEADYDRPAYTPQGEGADWANGVRPYSLRDGAPVPAPTTDSQLSADQSLANTTASGQRQDHDPAPFTASPDLSEPTAGLAVSTEHDTDQHNVVRDSFKAEPGQVDTEAEATENETVATEAEATEAVATEVVATEVEVVATEVVDTDEAEAMDTDEAEGD